MIIAQAEIDDSGELHEHASIRKGRIGRSESDAISKLRSELRAAAEGCLAELEEQLATVSRSVEAEEEKLAAIQARADLIEGIAYEKVEDLLSGGNCGIHEYPPAGQFAWMFEKFFEFSPVDPQDLQEFIGNTITWTIMRYPNDNFKMSCIAQTMHDDFLTVRDSLAAECTQRMGSLIEEFETLHNRMKRVASLV